jgi:hypothetical protein
MCWNRSRGVGGPTLPAEIGYQAKVRHPVFVVLAAANIKTPNKEAVADLTGSVLASLRDHKGKGVERTNEGSPARWQLKKAAN